MKGKTKSKIILGIIALIILVIAINPSFLPENEFAFSLEVPEELRIGSSGTTTTTSTQSSSSKTISYIDCVFSQLSVAYDKTGSRIQVTSSATSYTTEPKLDLTTGSGLTVASFDTAPYLYCKLATSKYIPIVVHSSDLRLDVHSIDNKGKTIKTHTQSISTTKVTLQSNNDKQRLGTFVFSASKITEDLPKGNYASKQIFVIYGTLDISFQGAESTRYHVELPANKINSVFLLSMKDQAGQPTNQDKDGDGIVDSSDKCPNDKETVNGKDDGDGCPDSATTQTPATNTKPVLTGKPTTQYCKDLAKYYYTTGNSKFSGYDNFDVYPSTTKPNAGSVGISLVLSDGSTYKCLNKNDVGANNTPIVQTSTAKLTGQANVYMQVQFTDQNTFGAEILATKGQFTGSFGQIPFNALIGKTSPTGAKEVSNTRIIVYFGMEDNRKFQNIVIKDSLVKFNPKIILDGKSYDLVGKNEYQITQCTINGVNVPRESLSSPTCQRLQGITGLSGANNLVGKKIASLEIRPSEIIQVTETSLKDGNNNAKLRVDIAGDLKIEYNDGTGFKPMTGGKIENTFIEWNVVLTKPQTVDEPRTETPDCNDNQVLVTQDGYSECIDKEVVETDIDEETELKCESNQILTPNSQTGTLECKQVEPTDTTGATNIDYIEVPQVINGKPYCSTGKYLQSVLGDVQCTDTKTPISKPKLGQVGVLACTSQSEIGGFPCTEIYRNLYCDGKTTCADFNVIHGGFNPPACNLEKAILTDTDPCLKGETTETGADSEGSKPKVTGGTQDICYGDNCIPSFDLTDPNNQMLLAVGIGIIAVIVALASRRSVIVRGY